MAVHIRYSGEAAETHVSRTSLSESAATAWRGRCMLRASCRMVHVACCMPCVARCTMHLAWGGSIPGHTSSPSDRACIITHHWSGGGRPPNGGPASREHPGLDCRRQAWLGRAMVGVQHGAPAPCLPHATRRAQRCRLSAWQERSKNVPSFVWRLTRSPTLRARARVRTQRWVGREVFVRTHASATYFVRAHAAYACAHTNEPCECSWMCVNVLVGVCARAHASTERHRLALLPG